MPQKNNSNKITHLIKIIFHQIKQKEYNTAHKQNINTMINIKQKFI